MVRRLLRIVVLILAAIPVTLGLILALMMMTASAVIPIAVFGGLAAGLLHWNLINRADSPEQQTRMQMTIQSWMPDALIYSVFYGAVFPLAVAGSSLFFGPSALLVWVAFALLAALARWTANSLTTGTGSCLVHPASSQQSMNRHGHTESSETVGPTTLAQTTQEWAEHLAGWTDSALCHAWRASCLRLESTYGHARMRLASERRAYLDELERRDPLAFNAWLTDGAKASSDPSQYFTQPAKGTVPKKPPAENG